MRQRIQKLLANAGIASRRSIEDMVRQGRISVNGRVVSDLPILVDPEADKIAVDGEAIRVGGAAVRKRYYFLLNKPKGVHSTNVAQGEQVRAIDLLGRELGARLYPVGRLDADSSGLLLLTNDGELTHQLTHPRFGVPKTYRAVVDGCVTPEIIGELHRGVGLADKSGRGLKAGGSHMRIVHRSAKRTILEITLREGRNRQVRQLLARLGHKVRDLMRIRMGPLTLEGLRPGQFRPLAGRELNQLRSLHKPPTAKWESRIENRRPRITASPT